MSRLTLEDLRKLRETQQKTMALRESEGKDVQIIIGMGTCGIAAGAKDTFSTMINTVAEKGLSNVVVRQTGCMGLCHSEPTVEVRVPDMPAYHLRQRHGRGRPRRSSRTARRRPPVARHHICDRPAADIMR
jgi:NADP-reducing hydrogenase subunit HndB